MGKPSESNIIAKLGFEVAQSTVARYMFRRSEHSSYQRTHQSSNFGYADPTLLSSFIPI